jgi:hypothetical protein
MKTVVLKKFFGQNITKKVRTKTMNKPKDKEGELNQEINAAIRKQAGITTTPQTTQTTPETEKPASIGGADAGAGTGSLPLVVPKDMNHLIRRARKGQ